MNIDTIQILGPYNSGTNLISKLLINNLENLENIKVKFKLNDEGHTLIWKHTLDYDKIDKINNENVLIIICYKNIYNWISSTFKNSYFNKINNITDICNFQSKKYINIIELYNIYYNNYIKLLEKNNVIFINYFQLLNPESYLYVNEKIKEYNLQIQNINNYQKILRKPSKHHGNPVKNYIEAYEKYFTEQEKYKNLCIENNINIDLNIIDYFENKNQK